MVVYYWDDDSIQFFLGKRPKTHDLLYSTFIPTVQCRQFFQTFIDFIIEK